MNLEKNKVLWIGLGAFLLTLVSTTFFICNVILSNKIYDGISLNNIQVSNLTKQQAIDKLNKSLGKDFDNIVIPISFKGKQVDIIPEKIDAKLDLEKAVETAFNVGRQGTIVERFSDIIKTSMDKKNINIEATYNNEKLLNEISYIIKGYEQDKIMPNYSIKGEKLIIKSGVTSDIVDYDKLYKDVQNSLSNFSISPIDISLVNKEPEQIDIEQIYEEVHTEPLDATYKEDNKKFILVPHKIGIDFDILQAKSIVETVYTQNQQIEIPLVVQEPKISTKKLLDSLFGDTLATFSTGFNAADKKRVENLKVASKSIDGKILLPGEEFSYNETLGPRTIENGYKEAHVYSNGKVIEGLGGGICQISTTLYNVALLADVEITQRRNHNMTVSYVKPGTDATVSYGSIDFKFKNNRDFPIKLVATINGGRVNMSMLGTERDKNKVVEITTKVLSTKEPTQTFIDDPTMPVGTTKVVQKGQKGYVVETYKIIKIDGVKVSEKKISKDKYIPMENIIKRGTKPVKVTPTVTPTPTISIDQDSVRPDGI